MTISDAILPSGQTASLRAVAAIPRTNELYVGSTYSEFPYCLSLFKTFGDREITAFDWANMPGQFAIYDSTDISASQLNEETLATVSTTAAPTIKSSDSLEGDTSAK
ncbi:hypothetical protein FPOAC1_000770 [Fusarium poae]|uniref:hypothetical protein n=1 Tax=Fusarium poae TaxID=36050 RepID=UPI001CE907D0|nr:hypothetical protein FPOAC1_000770 [Fusarium poae]KAG8674798.1 hypothetical protein FPOAC1_000770 [Fusarium poae]